MFRASVGHCDYEISRFSTAPQVRPRAKL